jgi:branched-chain amino acid transport system permease protein
MVQWLTFVIAGFWGSVGGLMFVYYNVFLSPHALTLQQSAEILLMSILGGASSLTGPIVGAVIITLIKNVVSTYVERWNTLLGATFIAVIIFMPLGLVPGFRALWLRVANRNKPKTTTPAAEPAE